MNTLKICLIAIDFLNAHVPPLDGVVACGADQIVTALPRDTWSVSSPMPRAWSVLMDGHGHVLTWSMAGVHEGAQ